LKERSDKNRINMVKMRFLLIVRIEATLKKLLLGEFARVVLIRFSYSIKVIFRCVLFESLCGFVDFH
jgi:hypothetical protein